jgi:hypothetical protein
LPDNPWKESGYDPSAGITFEQFVAWFDSDLPDVGDVVWCKSCGSVSLVTDEQWNGFVAGATLLPDNDIDLEERLIPLDEWERASQDQISALQKALVLNGWDWDPVKLDLVKHDVPKVPKFVRLMVIGKQVGLGVFKRISPDNRLEMFCVKMGNGKIRFGGSIDLGDADYFSFGDTNEEERVLIQGELAENGYIWNHRCHRLQPNDARLGIGKAYFWVNSYQEIRRAVEKNSSSDRRRFIRSNYFRTQEAAIRARNRTLEVYRDEMINESLC